MKVTFLGATHEVTGSCTLIETAGANILVDCGMEQGPDLFVNQDIPVNPGDIDCVLVTHAHIDHSGKLPLLCKNGFKGRIYATEETAHLCEIMLLDSAHIQEFEAEWRNRKAKRSGGPVYEPIYTIADAQCAIAKLIGTKYGEEKQIAEGVTVRFNDIGHLLGSACIEIWITENGVTKKIVFSGDVGNVNRPFLNPPQKIAEADYLVVESTYGDRLHEAAVDIEPLMAQYLQKTFDRGGNVVIPSFAVGRTQEILSLMRRIKDDHLVKGHDGFPVYVDSPLANEATAIFLQSNPEAFNAETRALFDNGVNPLVFPDLKISASADESKQINFDSTPKVIISASGMCEAGRIRHHLKHNLWRKECLILFCGYQSVGTLGRTLLDGAKDVKLFGEPIQVEAEIAKLPNMSGHADKNGLLDWVSGFTKTPGQIFVNHGEDQVAIAFAQTLRDTFKVKVDVPYSGTCYDLATGACLVETTGIPIEKKPGGRVGATDERAAKVFARLIASCEKLLRVAQGCKGMANKELARFADQVDALCDKWTR